MLALPRNKKILPSLLIVIFIIGVTSVWNAGYLKAADEDEVKTSTIPGFAEQAGVSAEAIATENTQAAAKGTGSAVKEWNLRLPVLFHAIGGFLYVVLWTLNKLVWLGASLAETVLGIVSFTKAGIVTTGWEITRGLCNMFFALVLLFMAFATVLQIETYGLKKTLPRLVIAALLINFSLVFAGIIIDFAQVITNFFVSAAKGSIGITNNLMNGLQITRIYDWSKVDPDFFQAAVTVIFGPTLQTIVEMFMGCFLFLAAAFSFFAMAFFLLVRIVWIWLLLIFAPLAWVSMIVPGAPGQLGGLWNKWWQKFFQWVFFAPIYAFFLYLALLIAQNGIDIPIPTSKTGTDAAKAFASSFFETPSIILQYIVIITILLGGLKTAQDTGALGAKKAISWVESMYYGSGRFIDRWLAKGAREEGPGTWKAIRRAGAYLAPLAWKRTWKARQLQKEREAYVVAVGAQQDLLNRILTWGVFMGRLGEKTDLEERALRTTELQEEKDIVSTNANEIIGNYENSIQSGQLSKAAGCLLKLSAQGDRNDILVAHGYTANEAGFQNFVNNELVPRFGQQWAYRLAHDMTRRAESAGQYWGRSYSGRYDEATRKTTYVQSTVADAEDEGFRAWNRALHPQNQARTTHRSSYFAEALNPTTRQVENHGLTSGGRRRIQTLLARHANDINPEVAINLMCNHAAEVQNLNPNLYVELRQRLDTLRTSNPTAYADLERDVRPMAPGTVASHWTTVP
jgi:hypothetical protein